LQQDTLGRHTNTTRCIRSAGCSRYGVEPPPSASSPRSAVASTAWPHYRLRILLAAAGSRHYRNSHGQPQVRGTR